MTDSDGVISSPEELIYRSCYAPVSIQEMLETAEGRSRIRRLPVPQLFFGLEELDDEQIGGLVPHVSEQQWTGILDLDLWSRDNADVGRFLHWQRHILEAEDAVARKLVRAGGSELWQLTFKRLLRVYPTSGDAFPESEPQGGEECLQTPDQNFQIVLPRDADQARLLRAIVERLYALDPEWTSLMLSSCCFRTAMELEEMAFQDRKRHIEDLGFQDYFDAMGVYTPIPNGEGLPEKRGDAVPEMANLPVRMSEPTGKSLLLLEALAGLDRAQEVQATLEELFFLSNRLLSADRISPSQPEQVKKGILKAVTGINLGIDSWSGGDLGKAIDGLRRHYLQSFFQVGLGRLVDLRQEALTILSTSFRLEPGSFEEETLNALTRRYPLMAVWSGGTIRRRFFQTISDLDKTQRLLNRIKLFSTRP
ncbi:MAG: DUF6178 family protein [Acidobacteriota bacterium]